MRIDGSRYEHEPLPGKKIAGILLRFSFTLSEVGYADLHPWVEYGDEPLETQLEKLLAAEITPLLNKCLWFAGHDAKARKRSRSLLTGLDLPTTHRLWTSGPMDQDAKVLKLKLAIGDSIPRLPPAVRLRLDFNGKPSYREFSNWWSELSPSLQSQVEVIEDPYSTGEADSNPRFYSDWVENPSWPGKVFKPARDFSLPLYRAHRYQHVLFTHALNHPVGQAAAIWEAARFYKRYPKLKQAGGFAKLESPVFQSFNAVWSRQGDRLTPPPGFGFGFDEQLRDLSWERLL